MAYSEADTRSKLIDLHVKGSGWLESNIVRIEVLTLSSPFYVLAGW